MRIAVSVFAVSALSLLSLDTFAFNQLVNPTFDTNTSGWVLEDPASSTLAWSPIDAGGSPSSGSALITNTSVGPGNGTGIFQCVTSVTAGASYTFGGKILWPTGQATTGSMQIGLRWRAGPNCTGSVLGSQPRVSINSATGAWVTLTSGVQVAPAGTVSADFIAFPSKQQAGGSLFGNFDDLLFDNGLPAPPVPTPVANVPVDNPVMLALMAILLIGLAWRRLSSR